MNAVFPGKPQAKLHAFSTALWEGRRIVTYISQNALIILGGPNDLIQSTQHGESDVLEAVVICEVSGKIATCTNSTIFVYAPFGQDVGALKWSLQNTFRPQSQDSSISALSWGLPDELLAAGWHLTLINTSGDARETWSRDLANPAKFAAFTPDANFIASTGQHDRLVKIWRREFLGSETEEERFDISYLAHPTTVTNIRWHRRPEQEHHADTVLYTTCADSKLRIWAGTDHHALQALELWTELDLKECIMPRNPLSQSESLRRYMFMIDGWEFETMVEDAIHQGKGGEREKHTREHLSDVAYRNPDVCLVMDDRGNMSSWGLERVGCEARQPDDVFNINLAEGINFDIPISESAGENQVCFCNFGGIKDGRLNVIANLFDGTILWLSSSVECFFDTSSSLDRFQKESIWTGHAEAIDKLLSSASRNVILSIGQQNEAVVWKQNKADFKSILSRQCSLTAEHVKSQASLLFDGQYVACFHESVLTVWNVEKSEASVVASEQLQSSHHPLGLVTVPGNSGDGTDTYLLLITHSKHCIIWIVSLNDEKRSVSLQHFADYDLPKAVEEESFQLIMPCNNTSPQIPVAYSVSSSGTITLWSANIDIVNRKFHMRRQLTAAASISKSSLIRVGSDGKAAMVSSDRSSLTVWDLRVAHLELNETFSSHETIDAIDITSNSHGGSLLAVAFSRRVVVYVQNGYAARSGNSLWMLVRRIDLTEFTNLPVADCVWLENHELLVATGNQMFLFDNSADVPGAIFSSMDITQKQNPVASLNPIAAALNSVPAAFHPVVTSEILLSREVDRLDQLFTTMHRILKFWSPGDDLNSQLNMDLFYSSQTSSGDGVSDYGSLTPTDEAGVFSGEAAASLKEIIEKVDLPYLSEQEQEQMIKFADSFAALEQHRKSADSLAIQYLVRLHLLMKELPLKRSPLPWRDVAMAAHSVSQDVMIDLTMRSYNGRMLWKDARECGMFLWIVDYETLRNQFENIGRNEYTKTDERNPIDCSLYYLALRKKQILVGLWRMATWHKEQAGTLRLLRNNFSDPRWQTAAQKNAYALLGLRRFEYAAAFFLLADRPKDAVNVLISQLGDVSLAIAVARVYEGDDGPVLKNLLTEKILPLAAREGNRWLASYAFSLLYQKDMVLRSFTDPLSELIPTSEPPTLQSKRFDNNEPSLVHFYRHLRDQLLQDPRDTVEISQKAERDFVMRSALAYCRIGCHALALDLVRNWQFKPQKPPARLNGDDVSSVAAALETTDLSDAEDEGVNGVLGDAEEAEASAEPEKTAAKSQRIKVTEEPSTASILDNFNF